MYSIKPMEKRQTKERVDRYLDDLYTRADVEELLSSIEEQEQTALIKEAAENVWKESAFHRQPHEQIRATYHKEAQALLQKIQPQHKKSQPDFPYRRLFAAAASFAILCVLSWSVVHYFSAEKPVIMQEVVTGAGEKRSIKLPDGSRLVVNACSRVRYPQHFSGDIRQIHLEGEAYFQVASDKHFPFVISTPAFDVRVLGTSFNIKAYEGDQNNSVRVESGKVQVDLPEAMLRLSGSEELTLNVFTAEFQKQRKEGEVSPWIKGGLRFARTPVRDVAKELERFYNCRITFREGQEFNNLISGEHDNSSLEAVLQSMEYISGIRYTISGNEVLLYK